MVGAQGHAAPSAPLTAPRRPPEGSLSSSISSSMPSSSFRASGSQPATTPTFPRPSARAATLPLPRGIADARAPLRAASRAATASGLTASAPPTFPGSSGRVMCSVVTTVPSACKSQPATVAPTRYTNDRAPYRPRSHVQAGAADRKRSHAGTPRAGVEGQRPPTSRSAQPPGGGRAGARNPPGQRVASTHKFCARFAQGSADVHTGAR